MWIKWVIFEYMIYGKFKVTAPPETVAQSHCTMYTNVLELKSDKILYVFNMGQLKQLWES